MLVGKESFCDYHTIGEAADALERLPNEQPETLYIMSGVYEEAVRIYRSNLRIVGIGRVEITRSRYAKQKDEKGEEIGTFATPTLFLGGRRLMLENLTVTNAAGQGDDIGQAVAVSAYCDEAVFRCCTFKGHQDTLFTGPLPPATKQGGSFGGIPVREHHDRCRQLYRYCRIEGTVDFIFGGATAYFEQCEIRSLRHAKRGSGYVTAASTPPGAEHGYVFRDCLLTAEQGVSDVYLGRPWREHAKTDFVGCKLGGHIVPAGWHNWDNPANETKVRYREFGVSGALALRERRVPWALCTDSLDAAPAKQDVFQGTDFWIQGGENGTWQRRRKEA
ncbi:MULTISPECIES: pectinesterase family protein [Paenibacillus]|uniref:Pectinesterase n=1 Tax=Paenibacillus albilobatus TaxID=2716884 RepID=A0A920CBD1_9BACL|nr:MULTISPECIES: pectinesterase family protein [Paenibacillus]GIO30387.1 pectinesterase [Paenibacillus albilobatus]